MLNYLYRNKDNQIYSYFVDDNTLFEGVINNSVGAKPTPIIKNIHQNFSTTFTKSERPNIFFKNTNNSNQIKTCIYENNFWQEQDFYSTTYNIEFFKVLQFSSNYAIVFCVPTKTKKTYDLFITFGNEGTFSTPTKIGSVFSLNDDMFKLEELSLNHYAVIYKSLENKKVSLNYIEVNATTFSKNVCLTTSDYSIGDDAYLFDDCAYLLYVKNKVYSQQLYLKIINNFNNITDDEILIFEAKSIEKPTLFLANSKLYVTFTTSKNTMYKVSVNDSFTSFSKLTSLPENSSSLKKYKLLGYSLPNDDFKLNNVYVTPSQNIVVQNKFCNIQNVNTSVVNNENYNANPNVLNQFKVRNQALADENKMLKKQLRQYDDN